MSKFSVNTASALAHLEYKLRRGARRVKHIVKKPHSPISILNDDVLLHIFYIHRLHIEPQDDRHGSGYPSGDCLWQRWWYKLAHVSRRWRHVILAAPSLLDLHLVCTSGVPVADMLAHSPSLPLAIFYWLGGNMILERKDEEGALIALSHRGRVSQIALYMEAWELEKLFMAMDREFPILKCLTLNSSSLLNVTLPQGFGAPNLYHGNLIHVALPVQCPLFTTTGLVSLHLRDIPNSGYFPPSYLLTSLSRTPQLETLCIKFKDPVSSHEVRDTATASHATLPNLRKFEFGGDTGYLEALCARMTAPVLSVFSVDFFNQLTSPIPFLLSFMRTSENLQFDAATLVCCVGFVRLQVSQLGARKHRFDLGISCIDLDSPIPSAIRILDAFSPVLSLVEQATLSVDDYGMSRRHYEVDRTQWRGLLRTFNNVKKLRVELEQINSQGLGNFLSTEDRDLPLELLPNLEEVSYSGCDSQYWYMPFLNAREALRRPVRLTLESW